METPCPKLQNCREFRAIPSIPDLEFFTRSSEHRKRENLWKYQSLFGEMEELFRPESGTADDVFVQLVRGCPILPAFFPGG